MINLLACGNIGARCVGQICLEQASSVIVSQVEMAWRHAIKENSALFNGQMLCLDSLTRPGTGGVLLETTLLEYKWYVASRAGVDVGRTVHPVAVSGLVLTAEDSILVACRADDMTQFPGFFECVPSGGIEAGDVLAGGDVLYIAALLREYEEEIGQSKDTVVSLDDFVLYYDDTECVYEICGIINTDLSHDSIDRSMAGSKEYHSHSYVPLSQVNTWLEENEGKVVPVSEALMRYVAGQ